MMWGYDMVSELLRTCIENALKSQGVTPRGVVLERPGDSTHGDIATNAALMYAKDVGMAPLVLAEQILHAIKEAQIEGIQDASIAGPGFINITLTDKALRVPHTNIKTGVEGQHILVEHSSPNLFKPFHIGHLMNNMVGEFVVRALKEGGARVTTLSFPSDVSLGIAKGVAILLRDQKSGKDIFAGDKETQVATFGEAYRRGVAYFEEHPEDLSEAKEIARAIYDTENQSEARNIFERAKTINTEYFFDVIASLGSTIDTHIYESEAGERGAEIVREHLGTVFTESEGAVVYIPPEERKDLHTQVFINSEGHPTYEAKDLGLLDIKFTKFNPGHSYFITDAEQVPHFKVVLNAAEQLGKDWVSRVEKSSHIPHGRMLFKGQKMSSRLGGVPLAEEVIADVSVEVERRMGEKVESLSDEERVALKRDVALGALRIAILRSKPGTNINFDPETSLSFEGDSGPYLLYTHARTASLLRKAREQGITPRYHEVSSIPLEHTLFAFENVLSESIMELSPQKLVTYLFEVAQEFNAYYAKTQILGDSREETEHALAIVLRVEEVLKRALYVLGMSAPERM